MEKYKLDSQLDRKMERIDRSIAAESGRKPIEEYDRYFFLAEVPYENSVVSAKIILCTERLNGTFKGIYLDTYGPWVLFKVKDIVSGDPYCEISPGMVILAKWDSRIMAYTKFIYKVDPKETDIEVQAISALVSASEYEIVTGNP